MPEPPYGVIWNRLKAGKVVPFLGAGASFVGRSAEAKWSEQSEFLPSGIDLAEFLAYEASFPSSDPRDREDLAKVSSYYVDVSGRKVLREKLRELFNRKYQSGPLHQLLAAVPAPLLVVVTNYDTLVEQAFRTAGKPYDLVIYPADRQDLANDNAILWWPHAASAPEVTAPKELYIDLATTTVIYKMHGTITVDSDRWDNFVITEEDYVEFLSRMPVPSLFYEHFRERSFLFLGYSLRDWNLRVVLKNLQKHLPRRGASSDADYDLLPSWAIQHQPSELEQRLWVKRDVSIFDITLDEFVSKMRERFRS